MEFRENVSFKKTLEKDELPKKVARQNKAGALQRCSTRTNPTRP